MSGTDSALCRAAASVSQQQSQPCQTCRCPVSAFACIRALGNGSMAPSHSHHRLSGFFFYFLLICNSCSLVTEKTTLRARRSSCPPPLHTGDERDPELLFLYSALAPSWPLLAAPGREAVFFGDILPCSALSRAPGAAAAINAPYRDTPCSGASGPRKR